MREMREEELIEKTEGRVDGQTSNFKEVEDMANEHQDPFLLLSDS